MCFINVKCSLFLLLTVYISFSFVCFLLWQYITQTLSSESQPCWTWAPHSCWVYLSIHSLNILMLVKEKVTIKLFFCQKSRIFQFFDKCKLLKNSVAWKQNSHSTEILLELYIHRGSFCFIFCDNIDMQVLRFRKKILGPTFNIRMKWLFGMPVCCVRVLGTEPCCCF